MRLIRSLKAVGCVEKKDGAWAIVVILLYAAASFFELSVIPLDGRYIYIQLAVQSAWLLLLALLVRLRGQRAQSVGLNGDRLPLIAAAMLTAIAGAYAARQRSLEIFGRWLFYLIAVAGMEEMLFRGFAYPRIAKWLGAPAALVITGLLFGAMHHIAPMVWDGAPWHGVLSHLGGGIAGNLLFLLVYAATGNIANAILLHAAMDFSGSRPSLLILCILYIVVVIVYRYVMKKKNPVH